MIIQIRATSGGGKTTVMRHLYDLANCKPSKVQKTARGTKTLINRGAYRGHSVYIIGPYDKAGTGGCDRISKIEEVIDLVHCCAKTNPLSIVAFEGLLLAHSWGQMGEFLHEHYGRRYINVFIDTSVEQCYRNVLKRREAAGADNTDKERLAKIHKNVVADHYRVELCHKRVIARGGRLVDVPYKNASKATQRVIDRWIDAQDFV